MLWTTLRPVIASIVGFFLGWTVFQIVRPVESMPRVESPPPQILEIKLKSWGCSDVELECPVFEMTLRNNGTGSFVGHANHWLKGKFKATLAEQDFRYLADEIEKQGFFQMPEHYASDAVDETIVVEVVTTAGTHHVSSYSWDSMDGPLRSLHARLWYEQYYVDWEEVK
jgi:hypothetical protein